VQHIATPANEISKLRTVLHLLLKRMLPARVRQGDFCKRRECFQRRKVIVLHKLCDPLLKEKKRKGKKKEKKKRSSLAALLSFGCKMIVRRLHVLKERHMRDVKRCSSMCLKF
jgi:hypothetical protein